MAHVELAEQTLELEMKNRHGANTHVISLIIFQADMNLFPLLLQLSIVF